MPTAEYQLWTDIQDIVGPASFWPRRIRRNFWTRSLSHWQRILTATVVWINGLNPEVFYDQESQSLAAYLNGNGCLDKRVEPRSILRLV